MDLVPVDHDPFANAPQPVVPEGVTLQPVDHDPWAPYVNPATGRPEISVSKAPAEGVVAKSGRSIAQPSVAEQVAGFPQRAADMTIGALGPIGEAGMTVGDMLRTGHVDPRDIPQIAGGVMLGVAAPEAEEATPLEAGAEAVAKGITAYHGSPYDFDKFDLSKIGTGEGAQAYGHGLYFAENPTVAKEYRDALSRKMLPSDQQTDLAQSAFTASRGDIGQAIQRLQNDVDMYDKKGWPTPDYRTQYDDAIAKLKQGNVQTPGKMYQVSINADPEHFLDWDKPLSEQSPQVQQAILNHPAVQAAAQAEHFGYSPQEYAALTPEHKAKLASMHTASTADYLSADSPNLSRGDRLYRALSDAMEPLESAKSTGAATATEALRQAGIPGIKYLDQGSRNINGTVTLQSKYRAADLDSSDDIGERFFASRFKSNGGNLESTIEQLKSDSAAHPNDLTVQKTLAFAQNPENEFTYRPPVAQTKNYVVFDDKLIDIIKKYGLAGLIAGGASHFATQPVDHDPFAARSQ